jgi:hypothetical protein
MNKEKKMRGEEVPSTEKIVHSASTIDHKTKVFAATEELILLGQDYAFVKKDDKVIGIVYLEDLLKEYYDGNESEPTIEKFMDPSYPFSKP